MMRSPRAIWESIRAFVVQYPAVLSGYVIYSYLFLCILRFFLLARAGDATLLRTYETFVAVPFLWLLALSLVKVIDIRTQLYGAEKRTLVAHQELATKHLQITTLKEVIRGVQDSVNNPLEVIIMEGDAIAEAVPSNRTVTTAVEEIKRSARSISGALAEFNRVEDYQTEHIGGGMGDFAVPPEPPADSGHGRDS